MIETIRVACVQMTSGPDINENLKMADIFIRQTVREGAQFVSTPENTCHIRHPSSEKLKSSPWQKDHPGVAFFSALAKELKIFLHIGSMAVKAADNKLFNRGFLQTKVRGQP